MCWSEKCCFFVRLDIVSILLGGFTFVLSLAMGITSIVLVVFENAWPNEGALYLKQTTGLDFNSASIKIIFSLVAMVDILWMSSSVILILGILKNRAIFVLIYFSVGIVVTMMLLLTALLVLLNMHWILALVLVIFALPYANCLIIVHRAYELLQHGKTFKGHQRLYEDPIHSASSTECIINAERF